PCPLRGAVCVHFVDVAGRDNRDAGHLFDESAVIRATRAAADEADLYALVRPEDAAGGQRGPRCRRARKELSALHGWLPTGNDRTIPGKPADHKQRPLTSRPRSAPFPGRSGLPRRPEAFPAFPRSGSTSVLSTRRVPLLYWPTAPPKMKTSLYTVAIRDDLR